jgi:nitroimidazol reductase NimA-like FMN-containing flavoprotein (pyridoxamine 5'-phosphate oxidase superfamily)
MADLQPTERTRVRRLPGRAKFDRGTIDAILDEGIVCHLGFVHADHPVVIPTLYARSGDVIYVHGSTASRMLRTLSRGVDACLTVTLLDGLVLARSSFHHSANYRSVVVFGRARLLDDDAERLAGLEVLSEHLVPGRWADARRPNALELRATTLLAMPLEEASAKIRTGPPIDDEDDYDLDVWAGVIPLGMHALAPRPDPRLRPGIQTPAYVSSYGRPCE